MKNWFLFLAICSFLIASSMAWLLLFTVMALGETWHESNQTIALLECFGSLCLMVLGIVGWVIIIESQKMRE